MSTIAFPSEGPAIVAVACCGLGRVSAMVPPWNYDTDAAGTKTKMLVTETLAAIDMSDVTNPAPEAVYRQGWVAGTGSSIPYTITGLGAVKPYLIRFHLCAPSQASEGDYSMTLECAGDGAPSIQSVDVVDAAGGGLIALVMEQQVNSTAGGQIVITATKMAGVTSALLNGFEVIPIVSVVKASLPDYTPTNTPPVKATLPVV
jgi:hypothetical protein